jgi:uncharacterized protein (DUF2132 family)
MQTVIQQTLHGITLRKSVEDLVDFYGFDTLAELIKIKMFFRVTERKNRV